MSYWKIGGKAECIVTPASIGDLAKLLVLTKQYSHVPRLVIGDSSNLLFDDEGFKGILIHIGNDFGTITQNGSQVYCDAGAWVPEVAYRCYRWGLSGIEHIAGIPGRIGGLIYMNGGSKRRGILENVLYVDAVSNSGEIVKFHASEIEHAYRHSPFQGQDIIVAGAMLELTPASHTEIRREMYDILSSRRRKFPRKLPSCGSVFLSNPNMYDIIGPPGFAIEQVGLKGKAAGGAQISPLHANFIVNNGGATSNDVLYLINLARSKVKKATGFSMDCEVRYVSPVGELIPAHIEAEKRFLQQT